MKKAKKITLITVATILVAAVIIVMVLFIPLNGKKNDYVWKNTDIYDVAKTAIVEKQADKEFKIMVVADLQLWAIGKDNKAALNMVKDLAASQKPDLILTVGDNVSGITTNYLVKDVINTFEEIGIPWAPIFGNHDDEGKAKINWQGDRFEEAEHCLFSKGPNNLYGVGNYAINIKEGDKYIQTLFMLDNGRYYDYPDIGEKEIYMDEKQIDWYRWNVEGLKAQQNSDNYVPSMTFTHFAPPQAKTAIETYGIKHEDKSYTIPEKYGFGYCKYLPGVAPIDTGFFDVAKSMGTHSMIFGHDHENDASIVYEGVRLTYAKKTGPSPKPWNDAKEFGATILTIGNSDSNYLVTTQHVVHSQAK